MADLLKHETALQFLRKIGVTDFEELDNDRLCFLGVLVKQYLEHIPFQCVSLLAQTKQEKHVPTIEEIIESSLNLEGGLCYTLNTFMCILLRTLGFKADVLDGCYSSMGDSHNHVIILLKDLRHPGDNYIIDVGSGFPFEAPLPVSELPYTGYHAGMEYRYEWLQEEGKGDQGIILRLHRHGDDLPQNENLVFRGKWRQVFHFNLKPVTFDYFVPYMEGIYVDETCDFHINLRANRFLPSSDLAGKDTVIMVAFKNQSLLVGPMDDAQKTKVSAEEWADKIKEYFPNIPPFKVDLAVKNMKRMLEEQKQ